MCFIPALRHKIKLVKSYNYDYSQNMPKWKQLQSCQHFHIIFRAFIACFYSELILSKVRR